MNEGIVGKGGDASVGEWGGGLGAGCPVLGGGGELDPGLESTAGAWASKEVAVRRAVISDCSLIIHFMHKVHLCYVRAW